MVGVHGLICVARAPFYLGDESLLKYLDTPCRRCMRHDVNGYRALDVQGTYMVCVLKDIGGSVWCHFGDSVRLIQRWTARSNLKLVCCSFIHYSISLGLCTALKKSVA